MLNSKEGGSRNSSSLFLAACAPVVPAVFCGRWNFVQSSLTCISAPSSFSVTELRWCLAGTAVFLKRNSQLWPSGTSLPEGGELWWKEGSSYAVTCLCSPSFFLGPFQCSSSSFECVTSLIDVRKWLVASHGGDEDAGLDTATTVVEGTELLTSHSSICGVLCALLSHLPSSSLLC